MAGPVKLVFQGCGLFEDLDVVDKVAPVDVEGGAETMLMGALKESGVAPVGHPCFKAIEKGCENYDSVDKDVGFVLQVLVIPQPFVQSTKGTVCFSKPVVHFFVYPSVW